jgi:predicted alternative tryptophan synthase beta-subunit
MIHIKDAKAPLFLCRRREETARAPCLNKSNTCSTKARFRCKEEGKAEIIAFNLSGHGHFDMGAYINYFSGKLVDQTYSEADLAMALAGLPAVAAE